MVRLLTNGSVRKKRARSHDRPLQKAKLAMPKNVEIKAAVHDWNRLVENAKRLSKSEGILIMQEDTFFNVSKGRLKLRNLKNEDGGQLIFYNRADMDGPKLSDYSIYPTGNPDALTVVLREDQSLEEGEAIAQKLMGKLGIKKEDLVTGAYMDLLLADQ
ncbi:uncharacterized protein [Hemitrygon akajei]|uniref:uncharacterized protein isoform X3 n=1 Tax=Hemitrygon akajei TaxID=2704970 RepID=UPI003BFA2819